MNYLPPGERSLKTSVDIFRPRRYRFPVHISLAAAVAPCLDPGECNAYLRFSGAEWSALRVCSCLSRNATTYSRRIMPARLKNSASPGADRGTIVRVYYFHSEGVPSAASTKFRHGIAATIRSGRGKHLRDYRSAGSFRSAALNFRRRDHYTKQRPLLVFQLRGTSFPEPVFRNHKRCLRRFLQLYDFLRPRARRISSRRRVPLFGAADPSEHTFQHSVVNLTGIIFFQDYSGTV